MTGVGGWGGNMGLEDGVRRWGQMMGLIECSSCERLAPQGSMSDTRSVYSIRYVTVGHTFEMADGISR